MTFLVFPILQKISTGSPILKFEFPLKICTKNVKLNMKNLSNITPIQDRLGIQPTDFLLTAFFSSSMASWASQPASSASHWLSSSVSDFDSASFSSSFLKAVWYMWHIILSVIRKSILHRLKYRDFGSIISLKYDQIGDPKTPFSNFLKYGENKKSHVFTIDNTNALKKKNVHNSQEAPKTFNFLHYCSRKRGI